MGSGGGDMAFCSQGGCLLFHLFIYLFLVQNALCPRLLTIFGCLQSRKYHFDLARTANLLQEKVVQPFLLALSQDGRETLEGTMKTSSSAARRAVYEVIEHEERRFAAEKEAKDWAPAEAKIAWLVAARANTYAAEMSITLLQSYLRQGESDSATGNSFL